MRRWRPDIWKQTTRTGIKLEVPQEWDETEISLEGAIKIRVDALFARQWGFQKQGQRTVHPGTAPGRERDGGSGDAGEGWAVVLLEK